MVSLHHVYINVFGEGRRTASSELLDKRGQRGHFEIPSSVALAIVRGKQK